MKKIVIPIVALCATIILASCAGPNTAANTPDAQGVVSGFWPGIGHGLIVAFSFIGSLFSDSVSIYEVHNNGGWYNFGFLLGVSALTGGVTFSVRRD